MSLTLEQRADRANGKKIKRSATTATEIAFERRVARVMGLAVSDEIPSDRNHLEREYCFGLRAATASGAKSLAKFQKSPLVQEHNRIKTLDNLTPRPSGSTLTFSIADASFTPAGRSAKGFERFQKTVLRAGRWKHPDKSFEVNATPELMQEMVANFKRLKGAVDVFVPLGHSLNPQHNTGFLDDLDIARAADGTTELVATLNIMDAGIADKIRQGAVRGVSVAIDPAFKVSHPDGRVEEVGNFVEHIALTMVPVVGGMSGFVPVN